MGDTDKSPPTFMSDEELMVAIQRNREEMTPPPGYSRELVLASSAMYFPTVELLLKMVSEVHHKEERRTGWLDFKDRRTVKSFQELADHLQNCKGCRSTLETEIWFLQQCLSGDLLGRRQL